MGNESMNATGYIYGADFHELEELHEDGAEEKLAGKYIFYCATFFTM